MNPRLEKLCLPRHRRDAICKFWQPSIPSHSQQKISRDRLLLDAKLEKIHPPIYWKSLDLNQVDNTKKNKINRVSTNERSCSDGCHYTTLIGKDFRVYTDFEHHGLQHATWKESIEHEKPPIQSHSPIVESSWFNFDNQSLPRNDRQYIRHELYRYFKAHFPRDHLFQLDSRPYPNRPRATSRRPRDVLHVDFFQNEHLKGSKTEATFKTFYHRKYFVRQISFRFSSTRFLPI